MMDTVIVSQDSFNNGSDLNDIIASNISFINVLKEENYQGDFCHEAELSYYLDYYLAQVTKGGFSLFVYNSGWNDELIALIQEGLAKIQANQHLPFFNKQVELINNYDEVELARFLAGDYYGKNPTREAFNNDEFNTLQENLTELNANWLKSLPNLQVLSIEQMFETIERVLGRPISRD